MTLFPFFEDIENKTFLVVGGGKVAKGKINRLKQFTDKIIVIAPKTDITECRVIKREFEKSDLAFADYVIGASDDRALNKNISLLCQARGIPVNIVDDSSLCTFIFPSLIKHGDLTVGITTNGKSPALSQYLRKEIEKLIPDDIESIIDEMSALRERVKNDVPNQKDRAEILKNKLIELMK
ncbi:MAG: bifunctional precorrin-2 dehydrogenase/sirohydrochlorin ferrochelatase [Clostridium sp.]|nr:bifunctional precorrin-2 dehydrogenase/sirohydrochlorin ferrochelatase [Clostridium sp.]